MYVGIDVGGTNLKAGLIDETGKILAVRRIPLGEFWGSESFVETLAELTIAVARDGGIEPESLEYVGMGIPGAVSEETILYTCNIPLKNVPVGELFRRYLPVPVILGNDADCAAVGEFFCGAGRGTRNFCIVTLGTGVGAGMILNGKLYSGMGAAGEVGHMVIQRNGVACSCGRRGCWETYASATGLIRMTREAMERDPKSLLWELSGGLEGVSGRTAFQAVTQGDAAARQVCDEYLDCLAAGITNLINILQPEVLALGGGVSHESDERLLYPLREIVERECYSRHGGYSTKIIKAELGNDAGLIGAALLPKAR